VDSEKTEDVGKSNQLNDAAKTPSLSSSPETGSTTAEESCSEDMENSVSILQPKMKHTKFEKSLSSPASTSIEEEDNAHSMVVKKLKFDSNSISDLI